MSEVAGTPTSLLSYAGPVNRRPRHARLPPGDRRHRRAARRHVQQLKQERQQRILSILGREGRVVATELHDVLDVSGYTVRRDLDELADAGLLQRVHGGALARSTVPRSYDARQVEAVPGKVAAARAAASLLERDQVAILDGGSTALHLVDAIPPDHTGTFITHSPPVADALGRRGGVDVVIVGGSLEPRAMVAVGAETIASLRARPAALLPRPRT